MSFQENEEILAIFLTEAEEIVQKLFTQLEELHYGYDGQRILHDIHRGFHTLYGGAAVLELKELADCAQLAEKVLDRLCSRRLSLSPSLVSLIVGATSAIEAMLARLLNRQEVRPVPADLRLRLLRASGQAGLVSAPARKKPSLESDRLDVFFDGNGRQKPESGSTSTADDKISDHEFESLLDKLYGKGKGPTRYQPSGLKAESEDALGAESSVLVAEQSSSAEPMADIRALARNSTNAEIGDLISELAWVRNRLMSFHRGATGESLNKALAYLDLVTRDMERWLESRSG